MYYKSLKDWSLRKKLIFFPRISMFPKAEPRETKLTVSLVIKCLILYHVNTNLQFIEYTLVF